MTVTAVIAEYNPFHNGHAYHLREARRRTDADFLIVLMSGDFVQRGEPAILDKYTRAEAALQMGADLVLELPACYSCASAEYFAGGAVSLLNALNCVDYLCFGSESGDSALLSAAADVLLTEPEAYRAALKEALRAGASYPRALQTALAQALPDRDALSLLSFPNDILGIEYLKALQRTGSAIRPVIVRRAGSGYHSDRLDAEFPSASAIRAAVRELSRQSAAKRLFIDPSAHQKPDDLLCLKSAVPNIVLSSLSDKYGRTFPLFAEDLSFALHLKLLSAGSWQDYTAYFDVPETLARRIFRLRGSFVDFDSFVSLVCTRNFAETHVRRALLHILLEIPADLPGLSQYRSYYAKILGLRKTLAGPGAQSCASGSLLAEIKKSGRLPLLSKPADAPAVLSRFYSDSAKSDALAALQADRRCCALYQAALTAKFKTRATDECAHGVSVF